MNNKINISAEALDIAALNDEIQDANGNVGAAVIFTGSVRGNDDGKRLTAMELEHYPGMTEKQLESIIEQARNRWTIADVVVSHRIGKLSVGEPIVFVGVNSRHRGESFAACEFIMDYLKTKATFWKKEYFGEDSDWVAAKQSDNAAAERWSKK